MDEPRAEMNIKNILKAFIPPVGKGARNFYYALFGRLMMVAGYQMITGYQLYIIKYYTLSDSGLDANGLKLKAASIVATMSVITMVVSLLAASPQARSPTVLACVRFPWREPPYCSPSVRPCHGSSTMR